MPAREGTKGPVVVSACGRSHRGRVRSENQDQLLVLDLAESAAARGTQSRGAGRADTGDLGTRPEAVGHGDRAVGPFTFELSERGAILLVADGMGGRAGGARASALAVASVGSAMQDGTAPGSAGPAREAETGLSPGDRFALRLRRALEHANRLIFEEANREPGSAGMGTTATLAGIREDTVYLAQVGDSRAYLARGGSVTRLTRDQSLVQNLVDSGVLSEREAEAAPSNRILQALGARPSVDPVITYHELRRGDVLVLCSDGLPKVVRDEEILETVRAGGDCLSICDRLIGLANDRGGPDNVTVIVARVEGAGLARPEDADGLGRRA